jgi:hypothetical protein
VVDPGFEGRVPRYRFEGFASQEAMDADEYDDEADEWAPTIPEMEAAMQVVVEVNRLGVIAPKLVMRALRQFEQDEEEMESNPPSTTSASSPSQTGGSEASTGSGPSGPTDPATLTTSDSPFPVFTG